MGAVERQHYELKCPQCGRAGHADWMETDGPVFLRSPQSWVSVSDGFVLGEKVSESFFGRRLTCATCDLIPLLKQTEK